MEATVRVRSVVWFASAMFAGALAMLVFMWAADAGAAPGDDDATFVPITPCRIIDTRSDPQFAIGAVDTFGPGSSATVRAHGTNGECVLPVEAVGLSLNVTALNATQNTFVTVWPGGERPNASSLNPQPGIKTFNAVNVELDGGAFRLFNRAGSVDLIVDVNGYYTASSLQELADRLTTLETLTAAMSLQTVDGYPVVRFTGVNVQVVNGSGETGPSVDGTGNLIVGYHEALNNTRTGSHNVVIGSQHTYTSYGGLVAGWENAVTAPYASVTGGNLSTADGFAATVSGGYRNQATGGFAAVSGGGYNTATGFYASVTGGRSGEANATFTSVNGGQGNVANGDYTAVAGGSGNEAVGDHSSVAGGSGNTALGLYSSIAGGRLGAVGTTAAYGAIAGGSSNTVLGQDDTVAGGDNVGCSVIVNAAVCGEGSIVATD